VTRYAQAERHALCDTMLAVGPDAPTLCDPWRTRDLAAHLVIRETRPDLAVGILVSQLAGRLDRAMADRAAGDFPALVEQVRQGPPLWSLAAIPPLDEAMNLMEFLVHHEDVLRAQPGWSPRELDPGLERAAWGALRRSARLLYRRAPVGVVLVAAELGRASVKGSSSGGVVIHGRVADLVMYSYGRREVADVVIDGTPADVQALADARLSL
jgi:uncharacterized protein (TIGR03085 family)